MVKAETEGLLLGSMTDTVSLRDMDYRTIKLGIDRTGEYIDGIYRQLVRGQFLRELLKNCFEAGESPDDRVSSVVITPDPVALVQEGVHRFMISDDGPGMSASLLKKVLANLSASGKRMGPNGNKGMGAKIATLPRSTTGLVYISKTKSGPWNMIRIFKMPDGNYGLYVWKMKDAATGDTLNESVVPAPVEYIELHQRLHKGAKSGTMVILLGRSAKEDSWMSADHQDEGVIGGLRQHLNYINQRFYAIPSKVSVQVVEYQNSDRRLWPKTVADLSKSDIAITRAAKGSRHYLDHHAVSKGSLTGSDSVMHWWLLPKEGENKAFLATHSFNHTRGAVVVLHDGEAHDYYASTDPEGRTRYCQLGIPYKEVMRRVFIAVEPRLFDSTGAVLYEPDDRRASLLYQGGAEDNKHLPWVRWGLEFQQQLPEEIQKALKEAQPSENYDANQDKALTDAIKQMKSLAYRPDATATTPVDTDSLAAGIDGSLPIEKGLPPDGPEEDKDNEKASPPPVGDNSVADGKSKTGSPYNKNPITPKVFWAHKDDPNMGPEYENYIGHYDFDNHIIWFNKDWMYFQQRIAFYMKGRPAAHRVYVEKAVHQSYARHIIALITHVRCSARKTPGFNDDMARQRLDAVGLSFMALGIVWENVKAVLGQGIRGISLEEQAELSVMLDVAVPASAPKGKKPRKRAPVGAAALTEARKVNQEIKKLESKLSKEAIK